MKLTFMPLLYGSHPMNTYVLNQEKENTFQNNSTDNQIFIPVLFIEVKTREKPKRQPSG